MCLHIFKIRCFLCAFPDGLFASDVLCLLHWIVDIVSKLLALVILFLGKVTTGVDRCIVVLSNVYHGLA